MINNESIQQDKIEKLASDSRLELNDIKACISLIEFVLSSGAKYHCDSESLCSELQQLGLPKGKKKTIKIIYLF
jgi:hypothetical protein